MNEWISNQGNKYSSHPEGCTDDMRKVKVKLRDGTEKEGEVWRFHWGDYDCPSDIVEYQYIDEEPKDLTRENENTLKVLECKEEDNGDVTLKLKLGTEALRVLLEQGLRAIIKNAAEEELQRIKESTPKKG
jgi:hypothetical protein